VPLAIPEQESPDVADFQEKFMNSLAGGFQFGQQIKAQRDTNQLNQLASLAYRAPQEQRQEILGQAAAVDAGSAGALDKQLGNSDDRRNKTMINMAKLLTSVPEQARPGLYQQFIPTLSKFGLSDLPTEYNTQTAPVIDQAAQSLVQAYGGGTKQPEQFTLGPGAKRFDASGNVVAEVPFAPANGNLVDVPDGMGGRVKMVWDPRTRQLSDLPTTSAATGQLMTASDGQPYRFDPGMDPADIEAAHADAEAGGQLTSVQLPDRNVAQFSQTSPRLGYTPPKQAATFTNLTPEEVAAMGLPVGTIAQRSPTGQVSIVNKPKDLPTGGQVIDNGDGTTTYIPAGKISEGERNASGFYQRMVSANEEMRRLEESGYDPTNRRDYYTAGGDFLNPLATPEGQQYRQAQDNWLRANLRKESGAAIGVAEMDQERKNYFPIPGDSSQVIQQKMRNRTVTERAMRSAAGGGLAPMEAKQGPQPGSIEDGYRFRGGDAADPKNWERI
jgi:hypothetical protein